MITRYFQDVAHDSGSTTNPYSVLTQYGDQTGAIQNQSTFIGSTIDTDPYPSRICTFGATCSTDGQLQVELDSVLAARGVARPDNRVFFIVTPPNVESCQGADGSAGCSNQFFCAYHSGFASPAGATLYAIIPYTAGDVGVTPACAPTGSGRCRVRASVTSTARRSTIRTCGW